MTITFDSAITEAAWRSAVDYPLGSPAGSAHLVYGLFESRGGQIGQEGWQGLIGVSTDALHADGHVDLAEKAREEAGAEGYLAWVSSPADGTFTLVEWGHDEGHHSGSDAVNASWDEAAHG